MVIKSAPHRKVDELDEETQKEVVSFVHEREDLERAKDSLRSSRVLAFAAARRDGSKDGRTGSKKGNVRKKLGRGW